MDVLGRRCIYYIGGILLLLVAVSARADLFEKPGEVTVATTQARQDAAQVISQAYQLSGMKEMTANLARRYVNEGLSQKLSTWVGEAIAQVVAEKKGPSLSEKINDPKMRAEMQTRIATRLHEEIPKLVKSVVYDRLFQGMLSAADPLAQKMVNHIVEAMVKPLNAQVDQWAGTLYGKAMERLDPYIKKKVQFGGATINLDATDVRGTIDGVMRLQTVTDMISGPLSDAMGESAFGEMQSRLGDFMNGTLPPEVKRALAAGPDKVDALIQQGSGYLPGAQLEALKAKMLALPVMTIPNEVYGSMLAASAMRHFALGFTPCPEACDFYEINRGREVTQVMIWQLRNKQGFNMSLGQLLDMSNFALGQMGGLSTLGQFGQHIADLQNEIGKVEAAAKNLDAQLLKYPKEFSAELRAEADHVRGALQEYYDKAAKPLQDWKSGVEDGLAQGAGMIKNKIPPWLNVPADWEVFKKVTGIPDKVLGEWGDQSVLDRIGVTDVAKKVNDAVSNKLSSVLVDTAQALLPKPEIKPKEKIPAQNPDQNDDYDPVLLHNGEFTHPVVDVAIPGRGLNFQFKRIYRSRSHFMGRLGWNWTHNFEEALRTWDSPQGVGLTWIDADGRKFFFKVRTDHLGEFVAPLGVFAELRTVGRGETKRFELTERGGLVTRFDRYGFLREKCDRFGNFLKCERDASGVLMAIVDTVGRRMQLTYDHVGRITQLTDNSGRIWKYLYDVRGDLSQVVSPATDLFPQGIATGYGYDDHKMTQIRDPRGFIFLKNVYGPSGFSQGQIVAQSYGGPQNLVKSRYVVLRPAWLVAHWPNVMNVAIDRVDLRDRRGVVRRFWHNANGNLLQQESVDARGKIQPGMRYRYNVDGMRVVSIQPSGIALSEEYWKTENRLLQGMVIKRVQAPLLCKEGLGEVVQVSYKCSTPPGLLLQRGGDRLWSYTYDSHFGDLSKEKSPDGGVREWRYDNKGSPLTLTLSQGEREIVTRFRSNSFGQIVAMTDPRGTVTQYDYVDGNRTATTQDAAGRRLTTRYAYDVVGNITAITFPNGGVRKFDVDAQNLIRREVTPMGYERRYDYDAHGNVTTMQVGNVAYRFGYDTLDHLISRQEPIDGTRVATTHYAYDSDGRLLDVTFPEGNRARMTYDARGDVTVVERGVGTRDATYTQYQYDADGHRVGVVDGLGHLTELERNVFGDVVAVIYPNKTRQEIDRDLSGRVVGLMWKDVAGNVLHSEKIERDVLGLYERDLQWDSQNNTWRETLRRFDGDGNRIEEVNSVGAISRWQYDALGNVVRADLPLGMSEAWQYNELGLPILYKSPSPMGRGRGEGEVHFNYDLQGRLRSRTDPNGAITKYNYDDRDNLLQETPPEGATIQYDYDGMGRRTRVIQNERVTRYDWDGNGRLRALTDPLGHTTRYAYDAVDRRIATQYPDGGVERLTYDANAQVTDHCMPNRSCQAQHYDAMGNMVDMQVGPVRHQYQYDPLGRMVLAQARDEASQFIYSSLSEVVESAQGSYRLKISYDANGFRNHMQFSNGQSAQWQRDALGRAIQVDASDGFHVAQSWGTRGPEKVVYGNGRSDTMAYDVMGNVVRQNDTHYSYTLLGNLTSQNATIYTYDPWQQLLQAGAEQWRYNLNGEREQVAPPQFDINGNMVSDDRHRYIYDALDRLLEVQDTDGKVIARYTYDALNRRTSKVVAGHTTTYVYDVWEPVEIYEDGKLSQQFVRGDGLDDSFGAIDGAMPLYFHRDRQGSVVGVSDASGKIVEQTSYNPFGSPSPSGEGWGEGEAHLVRKYTGQLFDAETGFYYMRNRYYSPKLGQFLTRDPIGYKNQFYAESSLSQPFSFSFHHYLGAAPRTSLGNRVGETLIDSNLYSPHISSQNGRFVETNLHMYVGNNPLNNVDPWGLYVMRLNRDLNQMNLYSQTGSYIGEWSVRTSGTYASHAVQYGSTPNGYYRVTAATAGDGFVNANVSNYNSGRSDINPASLGMGEVALHPLQTEPGTQSRSGIAIHGGGMGRTISHPYADHQGWLKTHGCVRMQNADIVNLVDQIHQLNAAGDTQGTLLVYSGRSSAAQDSFNAQVRTDARYWPPNMAQTVH